MAQPVYDADLARIIKDKEDETGLEAPLFGEATQRAAFEGKHWRAIGKAWRGRAGQTAFIAYRKQFPDDDNVYAA